MKNPSFMAHGGRGYDKVERGRAAEKDRVRKVALRWMKSNGFYDCCEDADDN